MRTASGEFLDTNILVYEWGSFDPRRPDAARKLVKRLGSQGVISSQVAQEFAWTARKKIGLTAEETSRILRSYGVFRFFPIEMRPLASAIATSEKNVLSFWDALIVEAAAAECGLIWTEDLRHGQEIRGVRMVNPFM